MSSKINTCPEYREALTEAAAIQTELPVELRTHLEGCGSCAAAFDRERQLFAAIDKGLRVTANAEVPASFLPGVCARLEDAKAPRRQWRGAFILVAASAAVVLTVYLTLRQPRPPRSQEPELASSLAAEPQEEKAKGFSGGASKEPLASAAASRFRGLRRPKDPVVAKLSPANAFEVIVPSEERDAFARFVSSSTGRWKSSATTIPVLVPVKEGEPMIVAPLEIAELEVKPLEALASEVPDDSKDRR